mmetsp:Transcript_37255/g.88543  ORF Transcript_37255/g.88543 Transcript_37255/m.88543 type:complete len:109 (-) Transcript_37255:1568-1894(-)
MSEDTLVRHWRRVSSTHNLKDLSPEDEKGDRKLTNFSGFLLVCASAVVLIFGVFAIVVSKLLPPFGNPVLRAIQLDWYYCLLVPLTFPVTVAMASANWLCMKLFRHNS